MPDPNSTQQRIAAQAGAFKVAAIQMASGPNVAGNLSEAHRLIEKPVVERRALHCACTAQYRSDSHSISLCCQHMTLDYAGCFGRSKELSVRHDVGPVVIGSNQCEFDAVTEHCAMPL